MSEILLKLKKPLEVKDIDFRVQSINNGGYATLLAYKDARVDMNRLDEVCGPHWQDKYELIDNQLFCSIGIKIDNEWMWRQDVGTESTTEKTKGRASDAFKRAGFRWGIGRELYDFPVISVKLEQNEYKVENNRAKATWNLKLSDWKWSLSSGENGEVLKLEALDNNGKRRFTYEKGKVNNQNPQQTKTTQTAQPITHTQSKTVNGEKPWLNVMDKSNKSFTKEWLNIVQAINKKTVTAVNQIREHYKVSKETEQKIVELLNY